MERPPHLVLALCIALSLCLTPILHAQAHRELHVLAASDLQPVMGTLADAFEHATGIHLIVSFGSSATLATQILNGDPADLFLAADFSFPEKIVAENLADTPAPIPYARGTLVLYALKDSPFQPLTQNTLLDKRIERLAIADELHAPYGLAAAAALRKMQLYDQLKPHFVVGENIAQTAQFVQSGNAQLGMISLTLASSEALKNSGSFIRIPPSQYPAIRQCAVVMRKSPHAADAHAFLDWLRSEPVQASLTKYGLDPLQ